MNSRKLLNRNKIEAASFVLIYFCYTSEPCESGWMLDKDTCYNIDVSKQVMMVSCMMECSGGEAGQMLNALDSQTLAFLATQ